LNHTQADAEFTADIAVSFAYRVSIRNPKALSLPKAGSHFGDNINCPIEPRYFSFSSASIVLWTLDRHPITSEVSPVVEGGGKHLRSSGGTWAIEEEDAQKNNTAKIINCLFNS